MLIYFLLYYTSRCCFHVAPFYSDCLGNEPDSVYGCSPRPAHCLQVFDKQLSPLYQQWRSSKSMPVAGIRRCRCADLAC